MEREFSTQILASRMTEVGDGAYGTWLNCPSAASAEFMCHTGFDFLVVDLQHSVTGFTEAVDIIRVATLLRVPVLVRLTGLDAMMAGRALDAGASGIICPMINDVSEAQALVAACRYPPFGQRSMGPFRPRLLWPADYPSRANADVLVFAMIETPGGLRDVAEIAKVPGLSGLFAGPNDIANSIGEPPELDPKNPKVRAELIGIAAAARSAGIVPGIACDSPDFAHQASEWGYRFHVIASDLKFMERGARLAMSLARARA